MLRHVSVTISILTSFALFVVTVRFKWKCLRCGWLHYHTSFSFSQLSTKITSKSIATKRSLSTINSPSLSSSVHPYTDAVFKIYFSFLSIYFDNAITTFISILIVDRLCKIFYMDLTDTFTSKLKLINTKYFQWIIQLTDILP